MTTHDAHGSPLCQRVWDRLVQGADVSGDAELGEHLRSCMACYRALSELRDAPRIAAMLRADAPDGQGQVQGQVQLQLDERFWDQLAERTGDAAAAAMARAAKRRPLRVAAAGVVLAAAAALMLFLRAPGSTTNGVSSDIAAAGAGIAVIDEAATDEAGVADVAALDDNSLRVILDRLSAGAGETRAVAATAAGDETDVFDDDADLDEVLAELDGPALRRVQRSLAGTTL
jgi:hypothetical protein